MYTSPITSPLHHNIRSFLISHSSFGPTPLDKTRAPLNLTLDAKPSLSLDENTAAFKSFGARCFDGRKRSQQPRRRAVRLGSG